MTDRIFPFSNGTQFMDWSAKNCERCSRVRWDDFGNEHSKCPLYDAIANASADDGSIHPDIARRIGYKDGAYAWDCPERNTPSDAEREEWDRLEREAIDCGLIVPKSGEAAHG